MCMTSSTPSTTTVSYQAVCPCGCGETVEVAYGGFAATTASVAACGRLAASGIADYTVRKSQAPAQFVAQAVRHRDGLVAFAGGLS
jgi:hypothetical protein